MYNSKKELHNTVKEKSTMPDLAEDFVMLLEKISMDEPPTADYLLGLSEEFTSMTLKAVKSNFFKENKIAYEHMMKQVSSEEPSEQPVIAWVMLMAAVATVPHPIAVPGILIVMIPIVDSAINQYKASLN